MIRFTETKLTMDFHTYAITRDAARKGGRIEEPDEFYRAALDHGARNPAGGMVSQMIAEQAWEQAQRPYYNVWPSIVLMLTRLNLDLDSTLVQLPTPALCVRLPKQDNPLTFDWDGKPAQIQSILMGESKQPDAILMMIDLGETRTTGKFQVPVGSYCNFPRQAGLTVEQAVAALPRRPPKQGYIVIPEAMLADCVRLCCSLCLLENDPEIITPDVLSKDREKFEETGDQKYVEKAHRRGKVGWDVGRHVEVIPHYRRPHLMLAWTGTGRSVPKIVPRRGTIVHRNKVEAVPSGFGE